MRVGKIMSTQRSCFKPHWAILIFLGLCLAIYLVLSLQDQLFGDPALTNVIKKISLLQFVVSYYLWFLLRSAIGIKIRLGVLLLSLGAAGYFYVQYDLVGWSGLLDPEFERVGSRGHGSFPALKSFSYDREAKVEGLAFTQFLGNAARDGKVVGPALHSDWNKYPLKERWREKIGEGLSGFSVQGDYAVTMEQRGPFEMIVCYDTSTGRLRWAHQEEARFESGLGGIGPRATVGIEAERVYSMGAMGQLLCVDLRRGTVIWEKNILNLIGSDEENEKAGVSWGRSGSVLLAADHLIVAGGGKAGRYSSLLAFDKMTGELAWKGGDQQISYASPQLMTIKGIEQIVSVNESSVSAHDTKNGAVLWSLEHPGRSNANANCAQVRLINGNQLFMSKAYFEGAKLFELGVADDVWSTKLIWSNKKIMRTKFSNTINYEGSLVVGLDERDLQAIDAATGKLVWEGGRYGYGQLLLYNHQLLVLAEDGALTLVDPQTGSELSCHQVLTGKTWCTIAIAGKYLLVRNNSEAVCFELPLKENPN